MKTTSIILTAVFGFFFLFHTGFLVFLILLALWLACGYANSLGLAAVEDEFNSHSDYSFVRVVSWIFAPIASVILSLCWSGYPQFFKDYTLGWQRALDNRVYRLRFPVEFKDNKTDLTKPTGNGE